MAKDVTMEMDCSYTWRRLGIVLETNFSRQRITNETKGKKLEGSLTSHMTAGDLVVHWLPAFVCCFNL